MVDSGPYPSDGESRAPRKHRHEKSSGHNGSRDANYKTENGYNSDRTASRNQHERSQNRHRNDDVYPEERTNSRHHDDRGRGRYQERDRHYEEKRKDRSQRERDEYRERDKYPADREHNRHQSERSRSHYEERDSYNTEKSPSRYSERDAYHQERSQSRYDERERQQERYLHSVDKQGFPAHSKDPNRYYQPERTIPPNEEQINDLEYYEPEPGGGILDCHKCRYLCTGRGMLQILEVVLNALVLICVISSYFVLSGFSGGMASGGFGGGYYPFEGQELQQVRQLDQEFTLLRSPLIYGGVTVTLLMGTLTCAVLAAGSKHLQSLSVRWLIFELVFSMVASLAYGAAVGVFLHFALQINSTDVCKARERLYARNGLTWMNCDLAGTDGGAATFAIILIILYGASAVLSARAYREKRFLQQ